MNRLTYNHHTNDFSEYEMVSRVLVLLAVITGLIYLRVLVGALLPIMRDAGMASIEVATVAMLLLALLGLLGTWRWQESGSIVAIVAGLAFGILIYQTVDQTPLLSAFFYSSPFVISGAVSLVGWWRERRARAIVQTARKPNDDIPMVDQDEVDRFELTVGVANTILNLRKM
jgi:hypothetical protein